MEENYEEKINNERRSCKDTWNAFLVESAEYSGLFEFPIIESVKEIPQKLIPFSKCLSSKDYDSWIHFYEDDHLFERIWRNPKRYIKVLKKYRGVILPDFSLYRDMPFALQIWNIYRSRAIGNWLQKNNIKVIPNIRFGDKRTYSISCDGIAKHAVISVGSHGTMKNPTDRKIFLEGLTTVVNKLEPSVVVIYGTLPQSYFDFLTEKGIKIIQFDSDYAATHKGVV